MRLLHLGLLAVAACRPTVVARPVEPERRDPVAPIVAAPAEPPAPAPAPEPAPTWEWALSVLPELSEHREGEADADALARFLAWFEGDAEGHVYALLEDACHTISGSLDADGFHGSWRREVTTTGDERTISAMSIDISRSGITESGPGGVVHRRDRKGRWQESGGFGTGHFHVLVEPAMSAADGSSVTFGGYTYTLDPVCSSTETITQTCREGGQRICRRCAGVSLRPRAEHMMSAVGSIGIGRVEPTPTDCSQACPADDWTGRLPGLASALKGRRFAGVLAGAGPTVFRARQGCIRELRRRRTAAAAREAEAADAR